MAILVNSVLFAKREVLVTVSALAPFLKDFTAFNLVAIHSF